MRLSSRTGGIQMSVTQSAEGSVAARQASFATRHQHLAPFLLAIAIAAASIAVSLAVSGLP